LHFIVFSVHLLVDTVSTALLTVAVQRWQY